MPEDVSDYRSNPNEQIDHAVNVIGRSVARLKVFEAVYHHKTKAKAISAIMKRTKLGRIRVLQEGRHLAKERIVGQTKKDGEVAYEMFETYHRRKRQILGLVRHPAGLAKLPTKRRPAVALPKLVMVSSRGADVRRITIDEISSFRRVCNVKAAGNLPDTISESQFKNGIKKIVRESAGKKDWGGEKNDLFTTHLRIASKRVASAFAFKGPGLKVKLVPGKMGKNGDQIQRLFQTDAELFLVQHWRDIDETVLEQMRTYATVKSLADGNRVYYGIIDGPDSYRLYRAYKASF